MEVFPILVDGEEVDTGKHTIFPDMEKVTQDPVLAIALQMRNASSFSHGGYKDSGIIGGKYLTTMLTRMKYVHVGPETGFL